jgi:hypothetical protein
MLGGSIRAGWRTEVRGTSEVRSYEVSYRVLVDFDLLTGTIHSYFSNLIVPGTLSEEPCYFELATAPARSPQA